MDNNELNKYAKGFLEIGVIDIVFCSESLDQDSDEQIDIIWRNIRHNVCNEMNSTFPIKLWSYIFDKTASIGTLGSEFRREEYKSANQDYKKFTSLMRLNSIREGSLVFEASIAIATFVSVKNFLKDYPDIKKGLKELLKDINNLKSLFTGVSDKHSLEIKNIRLLEEPKKTSIEFVTKQKKVQKSIYLDNGSKSK